MTRAGSWITVKAAPAHGRKPNRYNGFTMFKLYAARIIPGTCGRVLEVRNDNGDCRNISLDECNAHIQHETEGGRYGRKVLCAGHFERVPDDC